MKPFLYSLIDGFHTCTEPLSGTDRGSELDFAHHEVDFKN